MGEIQAQYDPLSPLPRHGREAHLLARIVEALLDGDDRNYEAFTPITMEVLEEGGIEPDYCFYMIEIDVTTYSGAVDYLPYRVPEVWLFKKNWLLIHWLENGNYTLQETSQFFPDVDIKAIVAHCLQIAAERGTGVALLTRIANQPVEPR